MRQPYAELLATGVKTIELRTWKTKFRGQFLIHSSKTYYIGECEEQGLDLAKLSFGAIIGIAELYDVKTYNTLKEYHEDYSKHWVDSENFGMNGFLIRNAVKLKTPVSYKGKLNFFEVDTTGMKLDLQEAVKTRA